MKPFCAGFLLLLASRSAVRNAELSSLATEDQAARTGSSVDRSDDERRARVIELLAHGAVRTPQDKFDAAIVLQHTGLTVCGSYGTNRLINPSSGTEELGVIVPAVHHPGGSELTSWLQRQAAAGATIVGVCDGVLVLARAGLLDGKRATAHWFAIDRLERRHPRTDWVRNARYVADGPVVTTAGVSASVPVSIALVEAIAGQEVAAEVAQDLGIAEWNSVHSSAGFRLRRHVGTAAGNWLAFWRKERVVIAVEDGVDELSLALVADLWSRTYRSRALTFSAESDVVLTRSGLRLRVDGAGLATTAHRTVTLPHRSEVGAAIPETLSLIAVAHGRSTAAWVASQIEYPWP